MNLDDWDDEDDCRSPECSRCNDTGRIVPMDGYHEYLGYDWIPCSCVSANQWVGMATARKPEGWPK